MVKTQRRPWTYTKAAREFHHFLGLDVLESIDTGNTVSNGQDTTGLLELRESRGLEDALLEDGRHLRCAYVRLESTRDREMRSSQSFDKLE